MRFNDTTFLLPHRKLYISYLSYITLSLVYDFNTRDHLIFLKKPEHFPVFLCFI
ncbi:hypothetical protein MNV_1810004 [Candidatus Methanoperedens nitroreducens]|uniref:Uncharacterized protein n=1 Tax=Candidatus Methanoperedens nitratireducens TaxID=1392998 RepID=A0A284VMH3_9EURY|nr:hypothetical protein MNV_1810004 [Candidatus Methanoperedens nitroreducens]